MQPATVVTAGRVPELYVHECTGQAFYETMMD